jgi:hypothetical protein
MNEVSVRHAVLNSLLFIRDPFTTEFPNVDGHGAVWSTKACIAVSCLPDSEGETAISLRATNENEKLGTLLASRVLPTPSHELIIETVLGETLLRVGVPTIMTPVNVWTNGRRDTDRVTVSFG